MGALEHATLILLLPKLGPTVHSLKEFKRSHIQRVPSADGALTLACMNLTVTKACRDGSVYALCMRIALLTELSQGTWFKSQYRSRLFNFVENTLSYPGRERSASADGGPSCETVCLCHDLQRMCMRSMSGGPA